MQITDYPSLLDVLKTNKKIIYIYGAGMSMALGDHRLAWKAWLRSAGKYLSGGESEHLDKLVDSNDADDLVKAADYALALLKEKGSYDRFMQDSFGGLYPVQQELIQAVRLTIRAGDVAATTNYDQLLERAAGIGAVTYSEPGEMLKVVKGESAPKVIHLHGMYEQSRGIDDIIADHSQYEEIVNNAGAQFIQNLIGTHSVIFVGCGGTVNDMNLSGFISFALSHLNLEIPYFYVCKKGDELPVLPANVTPVYYGSDHSELPPFLHNLTLYRIRYRSVWERVIRINPYVPGKKTLAPYGRLHFTNDFHGFVGRSEELKALDRFAGEKDQSLWWTVTGEGGIGKSRLVLEWLRLLPSSWFGCFLQMNGRDEAFARLEPFADTVVVIDYVLGHESWCAGLIPILMTKFEQTPYKLRILLLERRLEPKAQNSWYTALLKGMGSVEAIHFLNAAYKRDRRSREPVVPLALDSLGREDEEQYVITYLQAYFEAFPAAGGSYDLAAIAGRLVEEFHHHLDSAYDRPLFLSIYAEVWIYQDGALAPADVEELLELYLKREEDRFLTALGRDEQALNQYLPMLALSSAVEIACLNAGENGYLQKSAEALYHKLHDGARPGRDRPSWAELFIWEETPKNNPEAEAYMLIAPEYPDIIREFVVDYYIPDSDVVRFAKAARGQSILEFGLFLNRALEDFPEKEKFAVMAVTMPDDEADRIEYYATLLVSLRRLTDYRSVIEQSLLSSGEQEKLLSVWEMELWRRMAVVFEDRPSELEENAAAFLRYLKTHLTNEHSMSMLPAVMEAYLVGLHNGQCKDMLERFLNEIADLVSDDSCVGAWCAEGYKKLSELRAYLGEPLRIKRDVDKLLLLAERYPGDYDIVLALAETASRYIGVIVQRGMTGRISGINRRMLAAFDQLPQVEPEQEEWNTLCLAAGHIALCLANEYYCFYERRVELEDAKEHLIFCENRICQLYDRFPEEEKVLMAYATLTADLLMEQRGVVEITRELCAQYREWFQDYPGVIEFAESYGKVLELRCRFLRAEGDFRELLGCIQELERVVQEIDDDKGDLEETPLEKRLTMIKADILQR